MSAADTAVTSRQQAASTKSTHSIFFIKASQSTPEYVFSLYYIVNKIHCQFARDMLQWVKSIPYEVIIVEEMENKEELLDQGITKILWYDEVSSINQWQEELKEAEFGSVTFCTSQPFSTSPTLWV